MLRCCSMLACSDRRPHRGQLCIQGITLRTQFTNLTVKVSESVGTSTLLVLVHTPSRELICLHGGFGPALCQLDDGTLCTPHRNGSVRSCLGRLLVARVHGLMMNCSWPWLFRCELVRLTIHTPYNNNDTECKKRRCVINHNHH